MEAERISEDGLSREVWRFGAFMPRYGHTGAVNIITQFYGKEVRASKRHKFVSEPRDRYVASDSRRYNSGIKAEDVPLPQDVADEIAAKISVAVHRPEVSRRGLA